MDDLDANYTHRMVNYSELFIDPEDRAVHTQNIERLWLDIKKWCKGPGIRANFLHQYLARYLFITVQEESTVLHQFLKRAAQLYPPQGQPQTVAKSSLEGKSVKFITHFFLKPNDFNSAITCLLVGLWPLYL